MINNQISINHRLIIETYQSDYNFKDLPKSRFMKHAHFRLLILLDIYIFIYTTEEKPLKNNGSMDG